MNGLIKGEMIDQGKGEFLHDHQHGCNTNGFYLISEFGIYTCRKSFGLNLAKVLVILVFK